MMFLICLASWGGHIPQDAEGGQVSLGLGVVSAVYSTSCVLCDSHKTTTEHAAVALTMAQQTCHNQLVSGGLFGQPVPITA
jgi:hypothetical protein